METKVWGGVCGWKQVCDGGGEIGVAMVERGAAAGGGSDTLPPNLPTQQYLPLST